MGFVTVSTYIKILSARCCTGEDEGSFNKRRRQASEGSLANAKIPAQSKLIQAYLLLTGAALLSLVASQRLRVDQLFTVPVFFPLRRRVPVNRCQ